MFAFVCVLGLFCLWVFADTFVACDPCLSVFVADFALLLFVGGNSI